MYGTSNLKCWQVGSSPARQLGWRQLLHLALKRWQLTSVVSLNLMRRSDLAAAYRGGCQRCKLLSSSQNAVRISTVPVKAHRALSTRQGTLCWLERIPPNTTGHPCFSQSINSLVTHCTYVGGAFSDRIGLLACGRQWCIQNKARGSQ